MNSTTIIESLNWRYATKKFDTTKKLSEDQLNLILETAQLTPSSYGLEPWKFVVVTNPAIREQLLNFSWNQKQVVDASHLLVLCARTDVNIEYVDKYQSNMEQMGGKPAGSLQKLGDMVRGSVGARTPEEVINWNAKQVYIALGNIMTVCALNQIDTCPMEGFDVAEYDRILGLEAMNLTATVILPIGFRSAEDTSAKRPKQRKPIEELVEFVK